MRVLIVRAEPGASATAARALARGFEPIIAPLFEISDVEWPPADPNAYDAVMMTSAHAARLGGMLLPAYWHLPLFAVGAATAQAAREAGFTSIHTGTGNVDALLEDLRDHGVGRILHLAGEDHRVPDTGWLRIERRVVYAARPIQPPPLLPDAPIILIHSPRNGARLAELIGPEERATRALIAISAAAADAAGSGWADVRIASAPKDDEVLACAVKLCRV